MKSTVFKDAAWAFVATALIVAAFLYFDKKEKEQVPMSQLSIEQIEKLWPKTSQAFRDAVFNNSLATAGIMVSNDGSFLAREPILGSDCRGEIMDHRALKARGNIPEADVKAIVRASACFTLTGKWG